MALKLAIVDYGMGNLHSVLRKVSQLRVQPFITSDPAKILEADKLILPGVGHFEMAMGNLKRSGLFESINEAVLVKQKPILGICLGMQLMAKYSEEGGEQGFGWLDSQVIKFNVQNKLKHKVPQTGWNTIEICKESSLLRKIEDRSEFYFLHAYHYASTVKEDILTKTNFEYDFVSSVEKGNIYGTQFHPEKSHKVGFQLLNNFIQL